MICLLGALSVLAGRIITSFGHLLVVCFYFLCRYLLNLLLRMLVVHVSLEQAFLEHEWCPVCFPAEHAYG